MTGSYQTECWHCDGPSFTAAASYCPWCGADLAGAEPEHRLWNTIQREGLDANPWDPTFVYDEPVTYATGSGGVRQRWREDVAESVGCDPDDVVLVSKPIAAGIEENAEGWSTVPLSEVLEE